MRWILMLWLLSGNGVETPWWSGRFWIRLASFYNIRCAICVGIWRSGELKGVASGLCVALYTLHLVVGKVCEKSALLSLLWGLCIHEKIDIVCICTCCLARTVRLATSISLSLGIWPLSPH